jgi:hypothetical protein
MTFITLLIKAYTYLQFYRMSATQDDIEEETRTRKG